MGRVTLWMQMSLDGFAEGPGDEAYWPLVDEELYAPFLDELQAADVFLYGRRTFELMAGFWPTADEDPAISEFYVDFARCWKKTPKLVISRTLAETDWDTRVLDRDPLRHIADHREQGCDIALFGGVRTANALIRSGLVDEYRLFVHPVALGAGRALFPNSGVLSQLRVAEILTFESAVIHIHYQCAV